MAVFILGETVIVYDKELNAEGFYSRVEVSLEEWGHAAEMRSTYIVNLPQRSSRNSVIWKIVHWGIEPQYVEILFPMEEFAPCSGPPSSYAGEQIKAPLGWGEALLRAGGYHTYAYTSFKELLKPRTEVGPEAQAYLSNLADFMKRELDQALLLCKDFLHNTKYSSWSLI